MFGTSQSGYNTTPPTIARVGLTNLSGANEPKFGPNGPAPVPLMPMPPRIRQDIANAVAANRVIGARWMYNDASLKSKNVMPVLTEGTQFTRDKYWVSVAKGVSVVTYLLGNVPLAGTTIGRICVKVRRAIYPWPDVSIALYADYPFVSWTYCPLLPYSVATFIHRCLILSSLFFSSRMRLLPQPL